MCHRRLCIRSATGQGGQTCEDTIKAIIDLAEQVLASVEGVSFAGQFWYDTQVAFSAEYQEKIDALTAGTSESQIAQARGGIWAGQSVRQGLENHRLRETSSGEPDGDVLGGNAVGTEGSKLLEQPAYHGTPYRGIDTFSTDKIGTGEGAQAYGWGLYFASNREIAEYYQQRAEKGAEQWTHRKCTIWR